MPDKTIEMPVGGIIISLCDEDGDRFGGGSIIANDLKEVCEFCGDLKCDFDCESAQEDASDRDIDCQNNKLEELEANRNYNYACDGVLSMLLGLAVAGEDVTKPAVLEALETAIDALGNNI